MPLLIQAVIAASLAAQLPLPALGLVPKELPIRLLINRHRRLQLLLNSCDLFVKIIGNWRRRKRRQVLAVAAQPLVAPVLVLELALAVRAIVRAPVIRIVSVSVVQLARPAQRRLLAVAVLADLSLRAMLRARRLIFKVAD